MKKIIIITIIIFITIILPKAAFAQQATLSLSPSSGTFNKSCPFSLDVVLDTGGAQTDGTDAIILYDASRFSAISINPILTTYPEFPGNNIDDQNGRVTISGLAAVSSPFSGKANLVTINFKVKDDAGVGVTQIKFDFDPNNKAKTTDSNVVQRGAVEILSSVVNGSYTVGTGSCILPSPTPTVAQAPTAPGRGATGLATPSATLTPTLNQLVDKTGKGPGTPELTFALAIVGSILTVLGILGLALL